jgi:hypothetical protein
MRSLPSRFMPYLMLGIMLVILTAGLILLSYLLVFGALVGLALFAVAWLKAKLFPPSQLPQVKPKQGRIIDQDPD